MSLHLSFSKRAFVFLSAGVKSGLIEIGEDWSLERLERILSTSAVEFRETNIGRCFDSLLLVTYFPRRRQSRIELEWSEHCSRSEMAAETSLKS